MKRMRRPAALIAALLLLLQSTLGVFGGILPAPAARATTYFRGETVYISDLEKGDTIEQGTLIDVEGLTDVKSSKIYIDGERHKDFSFDGDILVMPSGYQNCNFTVTSSMVGRIAFILKLSVYRGSINQNKDESVADQIKNNESVTLNGSLIIKEPIILDDGRDHEVYMEGNDIIRIGLNNYDYEGSVFIVKNGTTLRVMDDTSREYGTISGGYADTGGAICLEGGSKLYLGCVNISDCHAKKGGGIYVGDSSKAELYDVTITDTNKDIEYDNRFSGGDIYVDGSGKCEISKSVIKNGRSKEGGGICNTGNTEVYSSKIENNYGSENGGGIYNSGELYVKETEFTNNSCGHNAGAIYNKGKMTLEDCSVSLNNAVANGGGIYASLNSDDAKMIWKGNNKIKNNAAAAGGGIYVEGSNKTQIKDADISDNFAKEAGGALGYPEWGGGLELNNVTMKDNTSEGAGGAISCASGISITDSSITRNMSARSGGAILARDSADSYNIEINNSSITSNLSYEKGGGIYVTNEDTKIIFHGGKTVIDANESFPGDKPENSNLLIKHFKIFYIKGTFDEGSKIRFSYEGLVTSNTVSRDYAQYNEADAIDIFTYDKDERRVDDDEAFVEVTLEDVALPTASGYKVRVTVKVTDDAWAWKDAHLELYGRKHNGASDDRYRMKDSDDFSSKLTKVTTQDYDYKWEVDCENSFPSDISFKMKWDSDGQKRDFEADVKVYINDTFVASRHISESFYGWIWDDSVTADCSIVIPDEKYPTIKKKVINQKREIDLVDDKTGEVSISMVDQYGVEIRPVSKEYFKIENLNFPGEDTYECLDENGLKWKFNTTIRDACHTSTYRIKYKTGPLWQSLDIPVSFKAPLKLTVRMGNKDRGYVTVMEKEGHPGDVIKVGSPTPDEGYLLGNCSKNKSCVWDDPDGDGIYDFGFITDNVVVTFETTPIKYIIEYNANTGEKSKTRRKTYKYGVEYNLEVIGFTNKGYKQSGWNTKKDGSGTLYANKATIKSLSSKQSEVIVLYAMWSDNNGDPNVTASIFSKGKIGLWIGLAVFSATALLFGCLKILKRRS